MTPMSSTESHDFDWSEPLLSWLDGDLEAAGAAAFEAHSAGCPRCQQQLQALAALDAKLRTALPSISLDGNFDHALYARIDATDESPRRDARQRAEQELQENLRSLSRSWRRTLGLVIPGAIAGIALAFALTGFLTDTGVTQATTQSAQGLGSALAGMLPLLLTGLVGATTGGIVARWLMAE